MARGQTAESLCGISVFSGGAGAPVPAIRPAASEIGAEFGIVGQAVDRQESGRSGGDAMRPVDTHALIQRYIELSRARDAPGLAALYADDATVESPSIGTHRGRNAIEEGYRQWFKSFPDLDMVSEGVIAAESQASLELRLAGTHQGHFLGLPPTGKRMEFHAVFLMTFRDDTIVRERRIYDFTGLLIKLGLLKVKPI